ncbi:MAG: hypothetical protein HAW62_01785 [Endozoicomonadaceae bacterium]|nr:hypothetical protein [Endozoicomonadaceae bacterium]
MKHLLLWLYCILILTTSYSNQGLCVANPIQPDDQPTINQSKKKTELIFS